jgi:hypothetical protein
MRLYNLADFNELQIVQVEQLQSLLADRPELTSYMTEAGMALPFLPMLVHSQTFRARAQYVETPEIAGISYLTAFNAAVEPFMSTSFLYTFQGLSKNSGQYVSVIFPLETTLFPAEPEPIDLDVFVAQLPDYMAAAVTNLTEAGADEFTPSLTRLNDLITSFAFEA